ncbi:glycoside hydrolase/deacetylase [Rhizopus microsporus ATCC 52813]|uniref:Glycoside hydrolase/deacetylase n=1 Tax=Rhizopus microsporus ATCC 52813 TaxID=1340429 RepID=A0A2G4SVZ4_RHIZD|nr:glycoside hydrolase/deacetylase [Rhizopus microsporus ATCC 52813]PHZ12950.1 glycoside hydrolase/deacetylase [Rhizopus microsporus ATCC 52813]
MKAHDVKQVSQTSTSLLAQTSPVWLSDVHGPLDDSVVKTYPRDEDIKAGSLPEHSSIQLLNGYPEPDKQPSADHPEVQAVLDHLDLSMIPNIEPRKVRDWTLDTSMYDVAQDPDCWWSASLCMKPKANYIPEDIYMCPNKGDWGLNFDDGPYKAWWPESEKDKKYDQPRLYNFLVNHGKQKATLFFVGSNVVKFPEAAIRALNDGHVICSHTWSHPQMTTLTNEQVVAQLYWTQKAIKQTLGITPRCWRPPYGDVDDRVRAIAWQMGMRTILWDQDSNDWNLVGGKIRAKAIDGYFQTWINARKNGTDDEHGHITLQHENSNATIHLSEKWLPKVQKSFRVMPIHQCLNDPHPYWEKNWIYPTLDDPNPPRAAMSDKESNVHGANVIGNANDATSTLFSSLKTSLYTTMFSSLLLFLFLLQ